MKIFYDSKIAKLLTPLDGFRTIMLFGAVFTEKDSISSRAKCHEAAHVEQYQTMFTLGLALAVATMFAFLAFDVRSWWMLWLIALPIFLYYLWYGIEYLVRLVLEQSTKEAYKSISFEREARALQDEYQKPCTERKHATSFSFLKYL